MGTRSVLCVPLRNHERIFGLIYLDHATMSEAFSEADLEMVAIIADLASGAVEQGELLSALRDNERELIEARKVAEAASRAKTNFLANVSHELRTPMNGVLGMTRQALKTDLSEQQHDYLNGVAESAEQLLEVIDDILDFSRMEAGELLLDERAFHLERLLLEVLDEVAIDAEEREVELTHKFDPQLAHSYLGDRKRLRKVLKHLLTNAVKFTPDEGKVQLEVTLRDQGVNFEITDSGIGMSQETLALVFEPFTQADISSTRSYSGMGMGLAICEGLIGIMGGELTVSSELGHGSIFQFRLPLKEVSELERSSGDHRPEDIRQLTILVVEDNPVNQEVARAFLKGLGHRVVVADNGQEALDILQPGHPIDVIFMDLQMPVKDGLQATIELRQREEQERLPQTPIIALTAHGTSIDERACREAGMNDFLTKPAFESDYLAALGRIFANK